MVHRGARNRLVGIALAALAVGLGAAPASAAVDLDLDPGFPLSVTAGQSFVAAFQIQNTSTGMDATATLTTTSITLAPSCTSSTVPCSAAEAGVFELPGSASGQDGTSCGGKTFTITPGAAGTFTFAPSSPVALVSPETCVIELPVKVLRVPATDAGPEPGVQANQSTQVAADISGGGTITSGRSSTTTVVQAAPVLAAAATSAFIGKPINGGATLAGASPTGTLAFKLFGPGDTTCTGTPLFSPAPVTVNGNGLYSSAPFVALRPGLYHWSAAYSGDRSNAPRSVACNAPGQASLVALRGGPSRYKGPLKTFAKKIGGTRVSVALPLSCVTPGGSFAARVRTSTKKANRGRKATITRAVFSLAGRGAGTDKKAPFTKVVGVSRVKPGAKARFNVKLSVRVARSGLRPRAATTTLNGSIRVCS